MSLPEDAPGAKAVAGLHVADGLERADELERRLIGVMEEGVIVFDEDGRPVLANARAIEITGIPFAELSARQGVQPAAGEATDERDQAQRGAAGDGAAGEGAVWEQLLEHVRENVDGLDGSRIEGVGRRADGVEIPFEARVFSVQAGQHQFFVTFVHDISDRKAAERRLGDARDAALRASVVKSEFLATMSHEIRTPMNGVIGSLDLMLDSELAPELAELAEIARTAANDLLAIIDDILDLSKIEADKLESRREDFDLVAIVESVADIVAVTARQKGLTLAAYVDPEIPLPVRGDPRLLRQILVNLVGNAVKFTDSGEVVVRAERQPAPAAQALVRFTVRDSGPGIPADAVATLFDPFTQVDQRASHERRGSGLGLAISSRLVRLIGGRLAVESEVGRGSVFSFELPLEVPEDSVADAPALPSLGRPLRVLIVDPSDTSGDTVERYLRAWGVVTTRVADAAGGRERFVAAAASERFDVAIVAAGANRDDANELARELRRDAGDEGVFLIALLEIGERLAVADGERTFDAVVGTPIKQSRLRDALAGVRSQPGSQPAEHKDAPGDLTGLRVLIAEDNPVNQQVLLRQVGRLGLIADAVTNGQEVLEALREHSYDAVLMDCQMPVMDGYTATREIRALEQDGRARLPIVAVTANAMRDDLDRCREAGMDEFVAKPVTLAALAGAIEHSVKMSRTAGAPAAGAPAAGASTAGGDAAADATGAAGTSAGAPAGEAPAAESGGAAHAAIDRPALDSLREDLGGADSLLRIVRLFLEQLDPQAEQIEREARAGELETLARNAHRMKSSAATLGATRLAELLRQLEAAAIEGDAAACDQLATSFGAAVVAAREAFQALLEELDVEVAAGG
jgi:signal transduction histidine kinase/DNA-binding response OmpR family regulator/HPt (histidine-containing phosphotransfer) domain-containing protein